MLAKAVTDQDEEKKKRTGFLEAAIAKKEAADKTRIAQLDEAATGNIVLPGGGTATAENWSLEELLRKSTGKGPRKVT